ncbi:MAG: NADH-quinone oxidoreductase subunit NuoK [Chitinophagaceae bacterium]|nr:NADH-quinone oxidoreductase subunit NuoK [Chitinophagaceae bacterium]
MEIKWYIFLGITLFVTGIAGVLTRRNSIIVLMSVELMLNSVNLILVAFSKMHLSDRKNAFVVNVAMDGQSFAFFIMVVGAVEVCIGLAIILMYFRNTRSVDINFLNRLKN